VTLDGNPSPLSPLLTSATYSEVGKRSGPAGFRSSLGRALRLRFIGISMAMYELPLGRRENSHNPAAHAGAVCVSGVSVLYAVTLESDSLRQSRRYSDAMPVRTANGRCVPRPP
jgi:hypothetical protein